MKLRDIAARLSCAFDGDGEIEISRVAGLEAARPGDLTFFANRKYLEELRVTEASAVIAAPGVTGAPCAVLYAGDPYLTFARAVALFADDWRPAAGVHHLAHVEAGATIAPDASVGAFAFVGEGTRIGARTIVHPHVTIGRFAEIGEDCVVHAQVSIRERVRIGNRVVLQNGVVLGGDGFGFAHRRDGTHEKIPQIGGLVDRRRRRDRREHDRRSSGRRGDADRRRDEDRQPGADCPRRERSAATSCSLPRSASPAAASSRTR